MFCYFLEVSNKETELERYKVWDEESNLEVSDFLRRPPLWEGKAAATISYKYKIYDKPEVKVAVAIDRFNSFFHQRHVSDYLLRHEAYHIRLAHFFAKEINQSIKERNLSYSEAQQFLEDRLHIEMQYQKIYDNETNHSLIRAQQNYWEYKIDSMLNKSIDLPKLKGKEKIEVYFPKKPKILVLSHEGEKRNGYTLEKYDMAFWIVDMEFHSTDTTSIREFMLNILFAGGHSKIVVNGNLPHPRAIFESYSKDTITNEIVLDKLLLGQRSSYWLRNRYPIVKENEELYVRMADQFFNSFRVIDE